MHYWSEGYAGRVKALEILFFAKHMNLCSSFIPLSLSFFISLKVKVEISIMEWDKQLLHVNKVETFLPCERWEKKTVRKQQHVCFRVTEKFGPFWPFHVIVLSYHRLMISCLCTLNTAKREFINGYRQSTDPSKYHFCPQSDSFCFVAILIISRCHFVTFPQNKPTQLLFCWFSTTNFVESVQTEIIRYCCYLNKLRCSLSQLTNDLPFLFWQ